MTMNDSSAGASTTAPEATRDPAASAGGPMFVCPYCGSATPDQPRCVSCRGFLDPLSRQASQNAMGPWSIRNPEAPHQSGCSYETLVMLVRRGRVTVDSVLRGPTTHQFWTPAKRVPAVANLLGLCHNCGCDVDGDEAECPECHADFVHQADRQGLGLMPVRAVPGQPAPVAAEAARGVVVQEAPMPSLAEPPPSLLRHVEALEYQNRWVWRLAITMLALAAVAGALVAAGMLSGFLRMDPSMGATVPPPSAPTPTPTPTPTPPSTPTQTGDALTPREPHAMDGEGGTQSDPKRSEMESSGNAGGPAHGAAENPPVLERPGQRGSADLGEVRKLIAEDTDESLDKAVRAMEGMGAGDGKSPELEALMRTAKTRQAQRALRGVR